MTEDCLFCKIVNKEVSAEIVYEDDQVVCFKDINPLAPVHLLVVPRKHIPSLREISVDDTQLIGYLFMVVNKLAEDFNIAERGFRVVGNCGTEGGQVIYHLHFHLLGGRTLGDDIAGA